MRSFRERGTKNSLDIVLILHAWFMMALEGFE
jgi:hypothetical protein